MDATISVVCYKSKVLSNGESPVMVRVAKDGKRSMKSLGVSVNPVYWDFAKNCPKKNCPNRTVLMQLISQTLLQYQGKVMEVKVKGEDVTASTIITENEVKSNKVTLEDFLTSQIQQLRDNGKVGNSYAYLNLRTTLHNFYGKKLNFLFNTVDVSFCNKFEAWMRKNQFEDTTMHYYFRTLRATYNKAIEAKCADREKSPFIEYKLSRFSTKTKKRALSKESVKKILKMDCSAMNEKARLAHNVFSFSYYCGSYLCMVAFEGKVSAGDEVDFGVGQVALECLGTGGDERRVVLAPHGHERRLVVAQILLELGIESHVRAVVENQVVLHLGAAGQVDVVEIEAVAVGAYAALGCSEGVLADDGLKGEGRRELLAQFRSRVLPIRLASLPLLAQPFLIHVAVLRDDGGDALGMPQPHLQDYLYLTFSRRGCLGSGKAVR